MKYFIFIFISLFVQGIFAQSSDVGRLSDVDSAKYKSDFIQLSHTLSVQPKIFEDDEVKVEILNITQKDGGKLLGAYTFQYEIQDQVRYMRMFRVKYGKNIFLTFVEYKEKERKTPILTIRVNDMGHIIANDKFAEMNFSKNKNTVLNDRDYHQLPFYSVKYLVSLLPGI